MEFKSCQQPAKRAGSRWQALMSRPSGASLEKRVCPGSQPPPRSSASNIASSKNINIPPDRRIFEEREFGLISGQP